MSKGDRVRPHDKKRYDENFEAAFGKRDEMKCACGNPIICPWPMCHEHLNEIRRKHGLPETTLEEYMEKAYEQKKYPQTEPTSEGGSRRETQGPTTCNEDPNPEDFQSGRRDTPGPRGRGGKS